LLLAQGSRHIWPLAAAVVPGMVGSAAAVEHTYCVVTARCRRRASVSDIIAPGIRGFPHKKKPGYKFPDFKKYKE